MRVGDTAMLIQNSPSGDNCLSSGQAHVYPLESALIFGANKQISLHFAFKHGLGV